MIDEYARTGVVATHGVVLKAGPIPSFSHSLEPQLRKLGLPTTLERGHVMQNAVILMYFLNLKKLSNYSLLIVFNWLYEYMKGLFNLFHLLFHVHDHS